MPKWGSVENPPLKKLWHDVRRRSHVVGGRLDAKRARPPHFSRKTEPCLPHGKGENDGWEEKREKKAPRPSEMGMTALKVNEARGEA